MPGLSCVPWALRASNPVPSLPALRILIAPSGFKESLGPEDVADSIEQGIHRALGEAACIHKMPIHDGGEGFARALTGKNCGTIIKKSVIGPTGTPVEAHYGRFRSDLSSAVIDMAAAAGLRLVPENCRDPTRTTTYGVGELIAAALDDGCKKILIGCGDSGTCDGGAGMLQALGVKLLDAHGHTIQIASGGRELGRVAELNLDYLHPRLKQGARNPVVLEAVCNIKNVLCGPKGVARVFGPQKGATPNQVESLADNLDTYASVIRNVLRRDISSAPGSGCSGGLGAALLLLGATLRPRLDAINEYFGLADVVRQRWDLVVTAEGSLDYQSARGKMTTEVARMASEHGAQTIALAGSIGAGAEICYGAGIKAYTSILDAPMSLKDAIAGTRNLLRDSTERSIRMVMIGLLLSRSIQHGQEV